MGKIDKTKAITILLVALFLISIATFQPITVKAQTKTLTVPDQYPTIQDAVDSADEGDLIFVRRGTYEGAENQSLIISKGISLIGEDAKNTIIILHPEWITSTIFSQTISGYAFPLAIEADNVRISGFTVISDGGALYIAANRTLITDNIITIHLQVNTGYVIVTDNTTIARNTFTDGLSITGSFSRVMSNNFSKRGLSIQGSHNIIQNNVIDCATRDVLGIGVASGHDNIVANNSITNCSTGILVGLGGRNSTFFANNITDNKEGIAVDEADNNFFYANNIVNNFVAVSVGHQRPLETINTFYQNNFINNTKQVNTNSSGSIGHHDWDRIYHNGVFNSKNRGNYWSDYTGVDANGDGIGDAPYFIDSKRSDNYPLMQPFDISSVPLDLPDWANMLPLPSPPVPELWWLIVIPLMFLILSIAVVSRSKKIV